MNATFIRTHTNQKQSRREEGKGGFKAKLSVQPSCPHPCSGNAGSSLALKVHGLRLDGNGIGRVKRPDDVCNLRRRVSRRGMCVRLCAPVLMAGCTVTHNHIFTHNHTHARTVTHIHAQTHRQKGEHEKVGTRCTCAAPAMDATSYAVWPARFLSVSDAPLRSRTCGSGIAFAPKRKSAPEAVHDEVKARYPPQMVTSKGNLPPPARKRQVMSHVMNAPLSPPPVPMCR